jgi:hypothetical protein
MFLCLSLSPTLDDHNYSFLFNSFTALDDDRVARGTTTVLQVDRDLDQVVYTTYD